MTLTPSFRKFVLTSHVASSVGWLGAVASFLALAVASLTRQDAHMVRSAYLAAELVTWWIIVPLAFASFLTGLVQGLGTSWGVFRHYWVLAKLLITVLATILLLVHLRPIGHLARVVAETTLAEGELAGIRIQLVANSGAGLLALLVATALALYKPRGLTPYGVRRRSEAAEQRLEPAPEADAGSRNGAVSRTPAWVKTAAFVALALLVLFLLLHLAGMGLGGHARGR